MTKTFEGCESEEEIHIYGMPCPQQTNGYDCMLYSLYCMEALSFCTRKDGDISLNNAMSKKVFFKSSEIESRDFFIAAIIQQKLVTDLITFGTFGSFESFIKTLKNISFGPFENYMETEDLSEEESDAYSEKDIYSDYLSYSDNDSDDDVSNDPKDANNEKSKKRKHMAVPKESNKEAMAAWIIQVKEEY